MKSVQEAFRPAFEEIQRRAALGTILPEDDAHFSVPPEEEIGDEFRDQEFVLVSMGTQVLAPRPLHSDKPCMRIYGGFPTRDDALEHMEIVKERDERCSFLVVRLGHWTILPATERVRDDPEEAERRTLVKIRERRERSKEERSRFEQAVKEHAPCDDAKEVPEEEGAEDTEAEHLVYAPPKRLRAGAEVRGQSVAAICVIPDEMGEPLVRVLGLFESMVEADRWCQDVGLRHVTEDDIVMVPTCDWFYPNSTNKSAQSEHYRIDELQRIMDTSRKNPQAVKEYKAWKAEQARYREERDRQAALDEADVTSDERPPDSEESEKASEASPP